MSRHVVLMLSALVVLLAAQTFMVRNAQAHALHVFATVQGDQIEGEAYYGGYGGPARHVSYRVTGPDGEVLLSGETDGQGRFRFTLQGRFDHVIIVDDGMGHRTRYEITLEDLPGSLPGNLDEAPKVSGLDESALRRMIETAVAREIRPLREELDRTRTAIRVGDVIGGLGYIAGLMGLVFFMMGRRRG